MPTPVFTMTDSSNNVIQTLSFGNIDAGSISNPLTIYIWNNLNGKNPVSDAVNLTITTKTYTGLDDGDSYLNGQEVITNLSVAAQCTSQGDTKYTSIGGTTTTAIGSNAGGVGTIQGKVNGDSAILNLTLSAPPNVTSGAIQFLLRLSFSYC